MEVNGLAGRLEVKSRPPSQKLAEPISSLPQPQAPEIPVASERLEPVELGFTPAGRDELRSLPNLVIIIIITGIVVVGVLVGLLVWQRNRRTGEK